MQVLSLSDMVAYRQSSSSCYTFMLTFVSLKQSLISNLVQEIASLVEAGHAVQISLNPITKANTEKALQRIITQNGLAVASQTVASIAEAANGDLRNALETLQLTCAGIPVTVAAGTAKKGAQVDTIKHQW